MRNRLGKPEPENCELEQIIDQCTPLVTRLCRSRLSGLPAADIEDAVQDTFLQLTQAERRGIANIEAWLTTVALRVCSRALRRRYRTPPPLSLSETLPSPDAASAIDRVDEQVWLAKYATLLPTTDVKVLHMLYLQDKTYSDVAKYFGISNGNARVLAYRARQHARGVIEGLD